MVRVIEGPKVKECTCQTCRSKLEYEFADITEAFHRDYTGCGETVYTIHCPNCRKVVYVSRW